MPFADQSLLAAVIPDGVYTTAEVARILRIDKGHLRRSQSDPRTTIFTTTKIQRGKRDPAAFGRDVIALAARCDERITPGTGVKAVARTGNVKLGPVAITIVARQSCPDSCVFKGEGCYAEHDNNRVHWDRLTDGADGISLRQLALNEGEAIDALPADRNLRLHIAGDSTTAFGTRVIANAARRYIRRGLVRLGKVQRPPRVWAYTHAWRTVPRRAWGDVSIVASCETPADVAAAHARGYAAALVVEAFQDRRTYAVGSERVIPCPAQTGDATCNKCGLCMDAKRLHRERLTIGFALHGNERKSRASLRKALPMVPVSNI